MYIIDFFRSLFTKSKIGVMIWIVLNLALIITLFSWGFQYPWGILIGVGVYLVSLAIALSPIGEFILRLQTGCKRIKDPILRDQLQPIFDEVYSRARQLNPELPKRVKLYINHSDAPNAFATGRRTVCVTRGLLEYDDVHIKAVLAHELGHLAHKDTDTILVVSVGNLIVTLFFTLIRIFANIFFGVAEFIASVFGSFGEVIGFIFRIFGRLLADLLLVLLMRLWTQIGVWLCMYSSRRNEFEADAYSVRLGYGRALCQVLASFGSSGSRGLFAALASSHPKTEIRIKRIEEMLS